MLLRHGHLSPILKYYPSHDVKNSSLLDLNGTELLKECIQPSQEWLLHQDELRHICKHSIEIGCLQLARYSLLLLLEKLSSLEEKETECEAFSSIHNELLSRYEHSMMQLWSRDLDSYTPDEYLMLIQALLINSQPNLAFTLHSIRPCRDKDIDLVMDVERGTIMSGMKSDEAEVCDSFPLAQLLRDESYPIPNESGCQSRFDYHLPNATKHQTFFSAHIIPKRLMIPLDSSSTDGYNYEHPAFDIPSLLWDKNLPEAAHWMNVVTDTIENISLIKSNFDHSDLNWSRWPVGSECPQEILCRIGLPNILDLLWTDQIKFSNDYCIITDFCPTSIAEQLVQSVLSDKEVAEVSADDKKKLLMFATDISYLMSFTKNKYVVDLSVENLLHVQTILCLPSPVKFILVDFSPHQLKKIVQSSYCSLYPLPLPFVFEDSTLMEFCCCWQKLNIVIKDHVPAERIVDINMETVKALIANGSDILRSEIMLNDMPVTLQTKRVNDLLRLLST